ncbi:MAG: murein L,D-transpeptidase [Hyphomicrobiaceae bacterium]|nr:murein L,D-transpeptidase [Hyphomicrobiaceae bacterium]
MWRRPAILLVAAVAAITVVLLPLAAVLHVWPFGAQKMSQSQVRRTYDRGPLVAALDAGGFRLGDPAYVRIFKQERRLEVWLKPRNETRYRLFRAYEICNYSGDLGPKLQEGDHQAPEGFYAVSKAQLNPNSRHHLAFNLGFPNAYDRALERTGSFLMVHGGCSSAGCYAVTDEKVDEIYAMVEAALAAGQKEVPVHAFPFDMTGQALEAHRGSRWYGFWRNLSAGYALFADTGVPPAAGACDGRYVFGDDLSLPACTPIRGWPEADRHTAS